MSIEVILNVAAGFYIGAVALYVTAVILQLIDYN